MSRILSPRFMWRRLLPMFSFRSFVVSDLLFTSFICSELIFVYDVVGVPVSFFHIWLSSFPSTLYWRDFYFPIVYPLLNINWLCIHGPISGLSILLCWSVCLFLCQYYTVLVTTACHIVWNQEACCLQLFFSPQDCFLWPFRVFCSYIQKLGLFWFCEKYHWNFDRDCIESVDCFE